MTTAATPRVAAPGALVIQIKARSINIKSAAEESDRRRSSRGASRLALPKRRCRSSAEIRLSPPAITTRVQARSSAAISRHPTREGEIVAATLPGLT